MNHSLLEIIVIRDWKLLVMVHDKQHCGMEYLNHRLFTFEFSMIQFLMHFKLCNFRLTKSAASTVF